MKLVSISGIVLKTEDKMRGEKHNPRRVIIETETDAEMDTVRAALRGAKWMHVGKGGKLTFTDAYPQPGEVEDQLQLELFWGKGLGSPTYFKKTAGETTAIDPSIYVQSISGYDANYDENAKALEKAGFEVLRSRRLEDGTVWEIWYLPGKWAAKGPIEGESTDIIVRWLFSLGVGQVSTEGIHYGLRVE